MKWAILFNLVLITLVAGDGAWKQNKEYKYKVLIKTLIASSKVNNRWIGTVLRARLLIKPQSENLLIGKIDDAEYAGIQLYQKWDADFNDEELSYKKRELNTPFKIHLQNGAIHSLSVDRSMTEDQKTQLKAIVSQLQVDTNKVERAGNNAFYTATEQTVTGNCETTYDISPLPDYLIHSNSDLIPLPALKGDGEVINIVKTRDHNKCKERFGIVNERNEYRNDNRNEYQNEYRMDNNEAHSETSHIVISGSLNDYTIQSSATTYKVTFNDRQSFTAVHYVHLKLESMEERITRFTSRPQILSDSNLKIEKLSVYEEREGNDRYSNEQTGRSNEKTDRFEYRSKEKTYRSNEQITRSGEQIIRSDERLTKGMPSAMRTNNPIWPVWALFILSQSAGAVIQRHSEEIAIIIQNFNVMATLNPSTLYALKDSPFAPPVVCIISEDELKEFWNEVEKNETDETGNPISFAYSRNCNELDKIRTGVLKLKYEYNNLLKQEISSLKYEELKAAYEQEVADLQKKMDDQMAVVKGEDLRIIQELKDQLQQQQERINKLVKKLEEETRELNGVYLKIVLEKLSTIYKERYVLYDKADRVIVEAAETFKKISAYDAIVEIVKKVPINPYPIPSILGQENLYDYDVTQRFLLQVARSSEEKFLQAAKLGLITLYDTQKDLPRKWSRFFHLAELFGLKYKGFLPMMYDTEIYKYLMCLSLNPKIDHVNPRRQDTLPAKWDDYQGVRCYNGD